MAFVHRCDRCHVFFREETYNAIKIFTITETDRMGFNMSTTEPINLCPECAKDLSNWIFKKENKQCCR